MTRLVKLTIAISPKARDKFDSIARKYKITKWMAISAMLEATNSEDETLKAIIARDVEIKKQQKLEAKTIQLRLSGGDFASKLRTLSDQQIADVIDKIKEGE